MAVVSMIIMPAMAVTVVAVTRMRMRVVLAINIAVAPQPLEELGAEQPGDQGAEKRQEDDGSQDGVHVARQPFMRLMSSTAMEPRLRK
jgi:hypothetical protein